MSLPQLVIKSGREKPLRQRHPWVFSGAIHRLPDVAPGAIVDIVDQRGAFLARGYANPASKLTARVLTWDKDQAIDQSFWLGRIQAAYERRLPLLGPNQNCCRLVMSEADMLPGLIVDKYGDHLVLQALTAGIDRHLGPVVGALHEVLKPMSISERSDDAVRDLEGLERVSRLLHGSEGQLKEVVIKEQDVTFKVDLTSGHKTGFYLDQRRNHVDLITMDPPKFASSGNQVEKAARGYKDLNMLAFKLLNPGGLLATFSCSGHISADLFQKIIFGAAIDAGRDGQIISYLSQADDHPVLLTFPESMYLKGLLCRVL